MALLLPHLTGNGRLATTMVTSVAYFSAEHSRWNDSDVLLFIFNASMWVAAFTACQELTTL